MLSELPETELDTLCDILLKEWPHSIPAISILRTCSDWKKKKPSFEMQILYNEKNIQSGIFILIRKSGCNFPLLSMYALDSYENELEEIFSYFLDKCEKIVGLTTISKKHIPIIEKVVDANAYKIMIRENFGVFSMDMDTARNLEICYPVDVEVKPLEERHLRDIPEMSGQIVQSVFNLVEYENRLELNHEFALGLFCKNTGRLLSRCMRSHEGMIASLQTMEEDRKKGFAKLLLKHVSKKFAEHAHTPFLFTDDHNEKGIRAAQGAGFHCVSHVMVAIIEKCDVPTQEKIKNF